MVKTDLVSGSRPYIGPFDIVTPDERWQQAEQRTQVGQRLSNGVGAAWSRVKAIPGPRTWFKRPQAHTSTGGVEAGGEAAAQCARRLVNVSRPASATFG